MNTAQWNPAYGVPSGANAAVTTGNLRAILIHPSGPRQFAFRRTVTKYAVFETGFKFETVLAYGCAPWR